MPSSLSAPGMGSGSDMAAALSSSMSEMAFALMVSSGSSASFEMSSSGIGQTASTLSDSFGTDWTSSASRSPQTVQESVTWSTIKTGDDASQRTGQDDLSKKKPHSQQLQNIKFLTQAPTTEESSSDFPPKEITSTQVPIEPIITLKQPAAQSSKLTAASFSKDIAITKAPSPSPVESVTESKKAPVTTPEFFQEPAKSRPFMSEASSSRRSVLEEMPIPTVSKPTTPRADGIGQDDSTVPCVTIPASPTIKRREVPSKIPTSPSVQRSVDAKYAADKLDNRADRFKQEQRKLVKAIKSDAKIGVIVVPSELSSITTHGAHGRDLSLSLSWDHKRSSNIIENVVSGGCALSSRPSSQSDEAGGSTTGRDEWREESTPSPDETDSTSQTTSSVASQEVPLSQSPQRSGTEKTNVQTSPKQKSSSLIGEGMSARPTAARTKLVNVPSTSMVKKPVLSSSSATKVVTPTSLARTTSSSSTVASSRSNVQGHLTKPISSVGLVKHIPLSVDQSLKGSSKAAASSSKLEEPSASSKSPSSLPKKSSGKDGDSSQSPKAIKSSGDDSKSAESSKTEGNILDKSSTSSSQSSSPRHRHHSGEAGSISSGRSSKSSQRKPAAPSATSTGSPRRIHEKCQLEKSSSITSRSGGQQGSSVPKYVAARPSQLSGPVTSPSPSSSSPSTPTSASSKLSQDRTPRLV